MRISNNVQALKAYRNLSANQLNVKTTMDKLSSGQKINRGADDAAGLAISEKMRNRLKALDKAEQNVLDGISMVQTVEGGLSETHSLLQRMRELAVQAGNGTLATEDRTAIQEEINQLTNEVSRIAETTQFNGKKLLTGGLSTEDNAVFIQTNAGASEGIALTIDDMRARNIGISLDDTTERKCPSTRFPERRRHTGIRAQRHDEQRRRASNQPLYESDRYDFPATGATRSDPKPVRSNVIRPQRQQGKPDGIRVTDP